MFYNLQFKYMNFTIYILFITKIILSLKSIKYYFKNNNI